MVRAHGGTLFLDEIGNLSLELQKSLLLVLQEGRYRPVGSVEERVADVKLVVATNEDLSKMVREGRFREDLYMRLNPATAVSLPTLHERRDDFQELLEYFMQRACHEGYNRDLILRYMEQRKLQVSAKEEELEIEVGSKVPERAGAGRLFFLVHPSSFNYLRDFSWPGNFRQFEMVLSNLITFTVVELVEGNDRIEPEHTGGDVRYDVVPILPRIVRELLRPWTDSTPEGEDDSLELKIRVAAGRIAQCGEL